MTFSEIAGFVNNTSADLIIHSIEIMKSLRTTGQLPEDINDLFTVTIVRQNSGTIVAVIDWA